MNVELLVWELKYRNFANELSRLAVSEKKNDAISFPVEKKKVTHV